MRVLVAVLVAVCLVLVFGAALFVQSAARALRTDLGVQSRGLVSVSLSVPRTPRAAVALEDLLERTRALPGVAAATIGPLPLVQGSDMASSPDRSTTAIWPATWPVPGAGS